MKWRKLGMIFDPARHALPTAARQFAQSPQALVLDDFVAHLFFDAQLDRQRGKYLSHIALRRHDKDFATSLGVSDRTVIPLGGTGLLRRARHLPDECRAPRATRVYGYTCGWSRRVSVPVETAIGLAVSRDDGLTFERVGAGPVLAASLREPFLVGDGFVRRVGDTFHMWYIFGTGWKRYAADARPDRTYKIGHAESPDGIDWDKEEASRIVADGSAPTRARALPSVIEIGGRHHMFFCYRQSYDFRTNVDRGYRIGHAHSDDLLVWTRDDDGSITGTPGDWDSDMQCYPHVFNRTARSICSTTGMNSVERGSVSPSSTWTTDTWTARVGHLDGWRAQDRLAVGVRPVDGRDLGVLVTLCLLAAGDPPRCCRLRQERSACRAMTTGYTYVPRAASSTQARQTYRQRQRRSGGSCILVQPLLWLSGGNSWAFTAFGLSMALSP